MTLIYAKTKKKNQHSSGETITQNVLLLSRATTFRQNQFFLILEHGLGV